MLIPVGVLTVLATIGGLVVIPGVWEPFLHWIDETAEPLVEADRGRGLRDERDRGHARPDRILPRPARVPGRPPARHEPGVWRVLEHKLYFDELYDALFYRPAAALSVALRRNVEEPIIERSLDEIGSGTIQVGGEVGRVQSGLLRTYAVAIAFAVVVLIVVFVAVR